ncbi:dTDP-4-amino-4,6-dideoxygalactose transaminase [Kibdelosporangium banguiense]|uniref:dTDP-4-amino-4,6-dideoxygalactose transaminase n=1 Tax=Kibdelosporangium banguiense TaxID=1365924 RepID=A0ABS4TVW8_9PSEU|nr:DegT/DnrJ/EryC1/StrS family aminotransferase [Kibdelosporangium banguiense]MBP2328513.1 dTDP-4-amino-4,6-dideoxygalactose transaminase [Kibdelosporangium banguiense]
MRPAQLLRAGLDGLPGLLLPEPTPGSGPSWFGFVITVLPTAGFTRQELVAFLEGRRIATRRFFGGNLTRHPAYQDVRYRVHGDLTNSDIVTDDTFWIGVYPGLTEEMIAYMVDSITEFTGARPAATVH